MGFPLCRMAALICLGSGAILDAASCGYHGKGSDEQTLLRSMLDTLKRGEVLLRWYAMKKPPSRWLFIFRAAWVQRHWSTFLGASPLLW